MQVEANRLTVGTREIIRLLLIPRIVAVSFALFLQETGTVLFDLRIRILTTHQSPVQFTEGFRPDPLKGINWGGIIPLHLLCGEQPFGLLIFPARNGGVHLLGDRVCRIQHALFFLIAKQPVRLRRGMLQHTQHLGDFV